MEIEKAKEIKEILETVRKDDAFRGVITHGYPKEINEAIELIEELSKQLQQRLDNEKALREGIKYIIEHSYQYNDVRDIIPELKNLLNQ